MISADASHGLAETLEGSRKSWNFDPLLPTVGLIVLGAFVVLYCVNPVLYQTVLRFWVGDPWSYPFLDLTSHLSHIECFSKGEDVYVTNTCDPSALTHTPTRFNSAAELSLCL